MADRQRLVEILADMLSSALAWEKEHGKPPDNSNHTENNNKNALTDRPIRIHSLPHLKLIKGGKKDDEINPEQERK